MYLSTCHALALPVGGIRMTSLETTITNGPVALPKPYKQVLASLHGQRGRRRYVPPQTIEMTAKVISDGGEVYGMPITVILEEYWSHPFLSRRYPHMVMFVGTAQIGDGRPWKIQGQYDPTAPPGEKGSFSDNIRK